MRQEEAERLRPFLPRVAIEWLREHPDRKHQRIDGTLAFVDVSGFTALTERLAASGRAGAEEVTDLIEGCFTELFAIGYEFGAEMLKWGGDAALLIFREPGSAPRASRAAWSMCRAMKRVGSLRTSSGRVDLRVSIGVHRGAIDLYLVGSAHRELIVTGPAASAVVRAEAAAEAGEVLLSPDAAAAVPALLLGEEKGPGVLLVGPPDPEPGPPLVVPEVGGVDVRRLFPEPISAHLLSEGERGEHRQATTAFVEFAGVDEIIESEGPEAVIDSLHHVADRAQLMASAEGVTFLASDVGADGGKVIIVGGIPSVLGNDEERVLRAVQAIVGTGDRRLRLRAGVNAGRVFVYESGSWQRRIYSITGDAVNLAARLMGSAPPGQVVATATVLDRAKASFTTERLPAFHVKGKREPIEAFVVGEPLLPAEPIPTERVRLLGRDRELSQLLGAAERVAKGRGEVVEIVAEAGMGKSVLVREAAAGWELRSIWVSCDEYGRSTPYLPFRHLLLSALGLPEHVSPDRAASRLIEAIGESAPHINPWLPLVGDVLGVALRATPEVEDLDRRFIRTRLADTFTQAFCALVPEPVAIVFEDANQMDSASSELLTRFVAAVPDRPYLAIVTHRPDEKALPTSIQRMSIMLGPIDNRTADELIEDMIADLALSAAERSVLVERAAGNPLFLRESVLAVRDAGRIEGIPDRLEPLLAAKVDRLRPSDRQVVRAAAVLGFRFEKSMVEDILSADERPALDLDTWRRLNAYVQDDTAGHKRFAHALMRDAAYEGLSFRRRRELHGRAADAISARAAGVEDNAAILSLHALHAERFEEAWTYGRIAGNHARSLYANEEAVTLYGRALQASSHLRSVSKADVASVAESMGDVAELAGRYDIAADAYKRARRLREGPIDRARLLRKSGVIYERRGNYREALRLYSLGRRLVEINPGPSGIERAELAIAYAGIKFRQGRTTDCLVWAELGAHESEVAKHQSALAHALFVEDTARAILHLPTGPKAQRALIIYEDLGDLVGQGNVLNNLGIDAYYRGRWRGALGCYERSRVVRDRAGDVIGVATQDNNIGEIFSDQGHFDDARSKFELARDAWRAAAYVIGVALSTSNLGRVAIRAGRVEEGMELLRTARASFEDIGAAFYVTETDGRLAEALVWSAGSDEAISAARLALEQMSALEGARYLLPWVHRLLGSALLRSGDPTGAATEFSAAVDLADSLSATHEMALALAARAVTSASRADATHAVSLMRELGIVDTPITSLTDRWPDGVLAAELVGKA